VKKKRVIPVLLLKDNWLVQSKTFSEYKKIGDPILGVKRFSEWDADELIYLNMTNMNEFSLGRSDTNNFSFNSIDEALIEISKVSNMPITIGGGIKSLEQIETKLANGADKISLNSEAIRNPEFVRIAAKEFGNQCVVISIDYLFDNKTAKVWNRNISDYKFPDLIEWCREVESLGAGEILINSINRDGMKTGYDLDTINYISNLLSIPLIACGGAGSWEDMNKVLSETMADGVAAANIFHFQDQSIYHARDYLHSRGANVRPPTLNNLV